MLLFISLALAQDGQQEDQNGAPPADSPAADPPAESAPPESPPPSEEAAREAELFGAPVAPAAPAASSEEDAMFGGSGSAFEDMGIDQTSDTDIFDRMQAREDTLDIGGKFYFRLYGSFDQDVAAEKGTLSSPNLLDLFVDARPNDRVRAFAQARVKHDFTLQEGVVDSFGQVATPTSVLLDQLWVKGDIAHALFFTIGQQRIKWGAGNFWNPTDFLNQQALDPLSVFDERTGVGLVRFHLPLGASNLYAVANVEDAGTFKTVGGAVRGELVVGQTELTASAAARQDQPLRLGADLSTGLWLLDLYVEGAVQHGGDAHTWTGEYDALTFSFPERVDRSDDWIPQVVAGASATLQLNDEDTLTLGGEYFFNDAGYKDATIYPFLLAGPYFGDTVAALGLDVDLPDAGEYKPFYLGRHYAGFYAFLPSPGQWDDTSFIASYITNLSDNTGALRLSWSQTVLTYINVNVYGQTYLGEEGGEFKFALDVPAVEGVEGLESGLSIAPPLLDVGVQASVAF